VAANDYQAESVNNVFGRTVNPRNRKLTSGGSSGGESALIAFGGSVLGVGTDIVRIDPSCDQEPHLT
jgi:amidase